MDEQGNGYARTWKRKDLRIEPPASVSRQSKTAYLGKQNRLLTNGSRKIEKVREKLMGEIGTILQ